MRCTKNSGMRERSGSHGSRRGAPKAAHLGYPGGFTQVVVAERPTQVQQPPGRQCGLPYPKPTAWLVRTLATVRPCAQVAATTRLPCESTEQGNDYHRTPT